MTAKTRTLPKPTLEEVLADQHTKAAFDFLVSRNASPEELWNHLAIAIMTTNLPRSEDMLAVDGLSRRQLREFQASIRKTARSIRLIQEHLILEFKEPMKTKVETLHELLIQYADRLESDIKFYRRFMAKNPGYWNLKSVFFLKLLDYVKKATGKPHFEKVSALLVGGLAAATAPGEEAIVDVDPDSLRKLYRRRSPEKINPVD